MFVLLPLQNREGDYASFEISELDYRLMARHLHTYKEMPWNLLPARVLRGVSFPVICFHIFDSETKNLLAKCDANHPLVFAEKPDWLVDGEDITIFGVYDYNSDEQWFTRYWLAERAVQFLSSRRLNKEVPGFTTVRTKLDEIEQRMPYPVWHPIDRPSFRDPNYRVEMKHRFDDIPDDVSLWIVWADDAEKMLKMLYRYYEMSDDCDGRVLADIPDSVNEKGSDYPEIILATAPDGADITEWLKKAWNELE